MKPADFARCATEDCPIRNTCLRSDPPKDRLRQVWIMPLAESCEDFIPRDKRSGPESGERV